MLIAEFMISWSWLYITYIVNNYIWNNFCREMEPPGQMEHWKCTQERQISANLARLPPGKARTPQMHSKATVAKYRAQLMVCFLQVWQPSLTPCHCTPLISAVHSSSPSLGSKFSMEFQWQHSASTTRILPTPQTVLTMSVTKTMSQVEFRLVTIVDIFLTFLDNMAYTTFEWCLSAW